MALRHPLEFSSIARVYLTRAGSGSVITRQTVTRVVKREKFVRNEASNWGTASDFPFANGKLEYVQFDLPKGQSCLGFSYPSGPKGHGFAKLLFGHVCLIDNKIQLSDLKDFVGGMELRP